MKLLINIDTGAVSFNGAATASLTFKRLPLLKLDVQFTRNNVVIELPDTATGSFEIKPDKKYDAAPVTGASAWVKTGTGILTVYTFTVALINTALDTLFQVDADATNDVAALTLMGEVQWIVDGFVNKTPTLAVTLNNDVVREDDVLPAMPTIDYAVFLPSIVGLTGGGATDLDGIPTALLATGTIVQVLVDVSGTREWLAYVLEQHASGSSPGIVEPADYNATTNDRRWVGAIGPSGPAGTNASPGSVWRNGSGAPSNALGINGDYYLNTVNGDVYFKASAAYTVVANLKGVPGNPGVNGSTWRNGTGVPANSLGINGDFYLNATNGDVYRKLISNYSIVANIVGPAGPSTTWRNGSGVPSNSLGVNGDYYLRTTNGDVYLKSSGAYSVVANIRGIPGTVWYNGSGAPSNSLGVDGDYYIDTDTGDVYTRTSGTYSIIRNIIGPAGATIRAGSGAPSNSLGANGDSYIDTSNGDLYFKASGTYSLAGNLAGTIFRDGSGAPSNSLGKNGDYYLRHSNGDLYLKASGTYSVIANLTGPAGTNGINGTSTTWRDGSGAPSNSLGIDGDYYLNDVTGDIYLRASGTYSIVATFANFVQPATTDTIIASDTNDAAAAGALGEEIHSYNSTQSGMTSGTNKNVVSISLTAGDWDVSGFAGFAPSAATISNAEAGVSTTSVTLPGDQTEVFCTPPGTGVSGKFSCTTTAKRISLASTTTVYLVAVATFSAGTVAVFGGIKARRMR